MALTFQTESLFPDLFFEMKPLLERHWQEIEDTELFGEMCIFSELYEKLHEAGMLHCTTARDDGALVGYAVYIVAPAMHYRNRLCADSDVFFLLPEYRKGRAGITLLQTAEEALKKRGVNIIMQKFKAQHDCGKLFERMGYGLIGKTYMRAI